MDATSDAPRSPSEKTPTDDAPGRGDAPRESGPVRIVCWSPSGVAESTDVDALAALVAQPDTRLWVDLTDPTEQTVRAVARTLELHPLIADDIEERNERAKVAVYDDLVHVVLFDVEYRGEVQPTEVDLVLGKQFLLSVHGSATDLARRVTMRDGVGAVLAKGHRLPALHDRRPDRRRLLPDDGQAGRRDRRPPGSGRRVAQRVDAPEGLHDEEGAPRDPAGDLAGAGGVQPADEPRADGDRPRAPRLLPRRLRPPDPGHRRARQLPRPRRRHARHLPLDGQQQPVADHEAADRRDRDPRRDRGRRRHLRDERGRHR